MSAPSSSDDDQNELRIENETGPQCMIGYILQTEDNRQTAQCSLMIEDKHRNRHGALHGGVISTMLDSACGFAGSLTVSRAGIVPFMTITLTTQFKAPALGGKVVASAKITGGGRKLLFIDAVMTREDGEVVATSSGVFKRAPDRHQAG